MEAKLSSKHEDDGVSLPEDIIFDVLVRLPANALWRFRCVSRAWSALICDPVFVAARRSRAGRLIVGVFGSRLPDIELRVMDMHGNVLRVFKAMDSVLLAPTQLGRLICVDRMHRGAMIVDPAAGWRTFTIVGRRPSHLSHSSFGRATPSGDYKVVRLHHDQPFTGRVRVCEVATITDDGGAAKPTWRRTSPPPPFVTSFSSEHKATVNGVLYFKDPELNRIAAFDLESEVWMETITGPPLLGHGKLWHFALTELKGTLCMVHNIEGPNNLGPFANIWQLIIDCNTSLWVKTYMIQLPEECLCIKPLDVLDDGRILLLNKSLPRYILQFFNPSTEAFTDIMEMAEGFTGEMTYREPPIFLTNNKATNCLCSAVQSLTRACL